MNRRSYAAAPPISGFRHEAVLSARVCRLDPSSFCPPRRRPAPRAAEPPAKCHEMSRSACAGRICRGVFRHRAALAALDAPAPRGLRLSASGHRALIPFHSLSFRSSFRQPRCGETLFPRAIADGRGRARFAAARFARLIAPARAKQMQGARLPWVPVGFLCAGAGVEGGAASGSRLLLHHSNTEISGSSPFPDFFLA